MQRERRVEPIEEARNAKEHRRTNLDQVVQDLVVAFANGDRRAGGDEIVQLGGLAERVGPRQERERAVFDAKLVNLSDRAHVGGEVQVRQHDAFRDPRRTARVEQRREIVRRGVDRRSHGAGLEKGGVRRVAHGARPLRRHGVAEDDEVLERRSGRGEALGLGEHGLRHDDGASPAIAHDKLPLARVLRLVHGD